MAEGLHVLKMNKIIIVLAMISLVGLAVAVEITTRDETMVITAEEETLLKKKNYISNGLRYNDYSTDGDCYIEIFDIGIHELKENYNCQTETGNDALNRRLKELYITAADRDAREQKIPSAEVSITGRRR